MLNSSKLMIKQKRCIYFSVWIHFYIVCTNSTTTTTLKEYNLPTELKDKLSMCSVPVAVSQIKFSGTYTTH